MISDIGRSVVQRIEFQTPRRYRRSGTPAAARAHFVESDLVSTGVQNTVDAMQLQPGEAVAVWELPPDEKRSIQEAADSLPPKPSRLLVRGANGALLELNPAYLDINHRPEGYREFTDEERAQYRD
jgi:hypothetical protein